jgi:hypothetical protein
MKKFLSIVLFILIHTIPANAGINPYDTTEVSCYLRIKNQSLGDYKILNFVLQYTDSLTGKVWKSKSLKPLELDSSGYLVKVDVPKEFTALPTMFSCTAAAIDKKKYGRKTALIEYGGVTISNIKLVLNSDPLGADAYLIPNRIWQSKIKNKKWEKNNSLIADYLVNTSTTNTFAHIDETVYVVVFKYKDRYLTRIHFTKPYSVEKEQFINVKF